MTFLCSARLWVSAQCYCSSNLWSNLVTCKINSKNTFLKKVIRKATVSPLRQLWQHSVSLKKRSIAVWQPEPRPGAKTNGLKVATTCLHCVCVCVRVPDRLVTKWVHGWRHSSWPTNMTQESVSGGDRNAVSHKAECPSDGQGGNQACVLLCVTQLDILGWSRTRRKDDGIVN